MIISLMGGHVNLAYDYLIYGFTVGRIMDINNHAVMPDPQQC